MNAGSWNDPLMLVLLGGVFLVVGVVLARWARRRKPDGTHVKKP